MHQQLFISQSHDYLDDCVVRHYNCYLRVNIGKFLKDDIVPIIEMDYINGIMQFWDITGEYLIDEFQMKLFVNPGVLCKI